MINKKSALLFFAALCVLAMAYIMANTIKNDTVLPTTQANISSSKAGREADGTKSATPAPQPLGGDKGALAHAAENALEERQLETSMDSELATAKPDVGGAYFEAIQAYKEFLLNRRGINGDVQDRVGSIMRRTGEFAILDITGDGLPELHLSGKSYIILTYRGGEVRGLAIFPGSEVTILNNKALFTVFHGMDYDTYFYYELSDSGDVLYEFNFTKAQNGDDRRFFIDQDEISEEQFNQRVAPYLEFVEENSDMMPAWTDYNAWCWKHVDDYLPIEEVDGYLYPNGS
jgi:hypothetical protein